MDTGGVGNMKKRKEKGGAEKVREKKIKQLESEASKCWKLTEMFACGSSTATAGSSNCGTSRSESQAQTAVKEEAAAAAAQGDEGQVQEQVEVPQTSAGQVSMKGV
ncbi:hypothetical protein QQF64_026248 [Cirrhinus molitorella]|uniref:Uncharacterized protein n=1 Tax=Cirrhinus molitorella TaxID=172907 RepID=A0ABR3NRR5_9TELE